MMGICHAAFILALGATQATPDVEESIRARCEQASDLLAADKAKEAAAILDPVLKEAIAAKSKHTDLAHYLAGCAAVALGNDLQAGRALSRLAPFGQPRIGNHARYLLARIHHRAGETTEAGALYDAIPAAFVKDLAAAKQALQNPKALSEPERARLDAMVKNAPAEFVTESEFYSGLLLYEQKKYAEALPKFAQFKDRRPVWVEEARLRQGMCHVQAGQTIEALKVLQPLLDHARLGRQARWWAAQAYLRTAEPKPAEAVVHLQKAVAAPESETGPGKEEILMTLGQALDRAGKPAEAVEIFKQLTSGARAEEALARLAGAHAAARQNREAEDVGARFEKQYPASPFLGDVLLRRADAAFSEAQAVGSKDPAKAKPLYTEAIKQYERCLAQGSSASAARYRMGLSQFRLGKPAEAAATLRGIPDAERMGDLAGASYLLAECILLTAPPAETATDGVTAAKLLKDLQEAAEQLGKYAPSAGAQAPEVTMKVGQVLQQIATLLAPGEERVRVATSARELYENFRATYPQHPLRPVAEYERANAFVLAGDPASAVAKLERFRAEPFVNAPVAPLALLRYGQLLRTMGQAPQAAVILAECRTRHEAALLKDPARAAWVPLLRYHHAAALKQAKQNAEAIAILESVVKDHAGSEWAESSRRLLREMKP